MAAPNNMDYSIARAAEIGSAYGKSAPLAGSQIDYEAVISGPEEPVKQSTVAVSPREHTRKHDQISTPEQFSLRKQISRNKINTPEPTGTQYQSGGDEDYRQVDYSPREFTYVEPAALDRPWTRYDRQVYERLSRTVNALSGRSISEFGSRVDPDVGCAVAVSLAVSRGYGFNVNEITVRGLERALKENGFTEVGSTKDIKPSDIILAYRDAADYGHAALYVGNGRIFNNDSDSLLMQMESVEKYNSAEFKKFVILRRPAVVPALPRGSS